LNMGRGKNDLKTETVDACTEAELVKEYKGEEPYKSFAKQRSDLGNAKAQGKMTAEECNIATKKVHDRRNEVIGLIEANVAAHSFVTTGETLEQETKRRKIDKAKIDKALELLEDVSRSSADGSNALEAAKAMQKAVPQEFYGNGGKQASKEAKDKIAAEKAARKEAKDKIVAEKAEKDPVFAEKKAAAEKLAAEKAAEKDQEKAAKAEAKKASQLAGLKTKANHTMEELRRKLEEAQERAKDPVAYDTKKKAENAKKEEKEKETDQAETNPVPAPDKKAGAEKAEEKEKDEENADSYSSSDEHAMPVRKSRRRIRPKA